MGRARRAQYRLLVRLSLGRAARFVLRPTPGAAFGALVPAILLLALLALVAGGGISTPPGGGETLGFTLIISGIISFLAYGFLFSAEDNRFLRHLGLEAGALFLERVSRLALLALLTVLVLLLPQAGAGAEIARALAAGIAAGAVATGGAALVYGGAALLLASPDRSGMLSFGIRKFDPELARAAPLVYAPLLPFLAGAAAAVVTAASGRFYWGVTVLWLVLALAAVLLGARLFTPAAGRFLPRAYEMAFAPPAAQREEQLRAGRGLGRLLPRRAAAVWVRDAVVAGRRYPWANRVTWPIALLSIVALARWGQQDTVRAWVLSAGILGLLVQAAAAVGLGIMEGRGPRWIDRSVGISRRERWLGRWAWSWGLSLWLTLPLAFAWQWWSGVSGAWLWPLGGALSAAAATTASLLNAERR